MAWVKVPPDHHPIFHAALPNDRRVVTMPLFGGVVAKVNGHIFAGLFARSTMVSLSESDRAQALALDGAAPFDPMGDGRVMGQKVMLPQDVMDDPPELRDWLARAFHTAALLPPKQRKASPTKRAGAKKPAVKKTAVKKTAVKKTAAKKRRP